MTGWTCALRTLAVHRDVRALMIELEKMGGWTGRRAGSSHIRLRHVNGSELTVPGTPGPSSLRNARADLRRAATHPRQRKVNE